MGDDRDTGFWISAEYRDGYTEDVYHDRGGKVRKSDGMHEAFSLLSVQCYGP